MASNETLRGELATRDQRPPAQQHPLETVRGLIEANKHEIGRALAKRMDPDRFARIVYTVVRANPDLALCTPASLVGAVMNCAQLGLEPGPLGEAYLVPFKNKHTGTREVTFIPGYRGLIKLALNSGMVTSVKGEAVHEHDEFEVSFGPAGHLVHKPPRNWPADPGARGKPIAYYAYARTLSGDATWYVMSIDDVEAVRQRSRAKDSGPWQTDRDAMSKKTAVRQLMKWLPLSAEVAQALSAEETVRTDYTSEAVDVVPQHIEDAEIVEDPPTPGAGDVE